MGPVRYVIRLLQISPYECVWCMCIVVRNRCFTFTTLQMAHEQTKQVLGTILTEITRARDLEHPRINSQKQKEWDQQFARSLVSVLMAVAL